MVLTHYGSKIIEFVFGAPVLETEAHVLIDHHADLSDRSYPWNHGSDFGDFGNDRI